MCTTHHSPTASIHISPLYICIHIGFVTVAIGTTTAAAAARNKTLSPKTASTIAAAASQSAVAAAADSEPKDKRQVNQHTRVPVANHGYGPSAGGAGHPQASPYQSQYVGRPTAAAALSSAEQPLQHKAFTGAEPQLAQQQHQAQQQQQLADQEVCVCAIFPQRSRTIAKCIRDRTQRTTFYLFSRTPNKHHM